jgi:hypothetical protein
VTLRVSQRKRIDLFSVVCKTTALAEASRLADLLNCELHADFDILARYSIQDIDLNEHDSRVEMVFNICASAQVEVSASRHVVIPAVRVTESYTPINQGYLM